MAMTPLFLALFCSFSVVHYVVGSSSVESGVRSSCQKEKSETMALKAKFDRYQTRTLLALQEIFEGEQSYGPCPQHEYKKLEKKLAETEAKLRDLEWRFKQMIAVATALAKGQLRPALVPQPQFTAKLNSTQFFSCHSSGEPLSACAWGRTVEDRSEVILIDKDVVPAARQANSPPLSVLVDGLVNGNCSLRIGAVAKGDFGTWSCVLFDQNSTMLTAQVTVEEDMTVTTTTTTAEQPAPATRRIRAAAGSTSTKAPFHILAVDVDYFDFDDSSEELPTPVVATSPACATIMQELLNGNRRNACDAAQQLQGCWRPQVSQTTEIFSLWIKRDNGGQLQVVDSTADMRAAETFISRLADSKLIAGSR